MAGRKAPRRRSKKRHRAQRTRGGVGRERYRWTLLKLNDATFNVCGEGAHDFEVNDLPSEIRRVIEGEDDGGLDLCCVGRGILIRVFIFHYRLFYYVILCTVFDVHNSVHYCVHQKQYIKSRSRTACNEK